MRKGIKEAPINIKDYYRELKEDYTNELKECTETIKNRKPKLEEYKIKIHSNIQNYKKHYKIDLLNYPEYVCTKYIDGKLTEDVNRFYRNCVNSEDVRHAILLVKFCNAIKAIYDAEKRIIICSKIINMKLEDFRKYIKTFYMEVQRQMIVNGYGYKLEGRTGTVIINRSKINKPKTLTDTKATKKNIERLKAQGIEIYDEKKAKYYKEHGLEYNGVNPRIYRNDQFCYEFCLLWNTFKDGYNYKFEPYDYWSSENRGKTKEDFIAESNGNLGYICALDITFRTKVTICNEIDKTLYLKFIRNENQSCIATPKAYR